VCTSSNARAVLTWALARGEKVLFFPDQHLGRNTGHQLGYTEADMVVWDPRRELGGLEERQVKEATFLLWKGHCSVHQRFGTAHIAAFRAAHPTGQVIVHPECSQEVVAASDQVGSTDFIIAAVGAAPAGSVLAIGTEIHLVQRLAAEHPDLRIVSLDPLICPCSTMFRVDAAHLCWVLEHLVAGAVVNRITVDPDTTTWARVALQRMLDIT
jgi:quinolinate synthase